VFDSLVKVQYTVGDIDIYGEYGLLEYVYRELVKKGHLVIVVAEGAGSGAQDLDKLKEAVVVDESGNRKLSVMWMGCRILGHS
jgi:hypothetical protein